MGSDDKLLSRYLDGELDTLDAEALAARLRESAELRGEFKRLERVDTLARHLGESPPAVDPRLSQRIMDEVASLPLPSRPRWTNLIAAMQVAPWQVAMAAGVLLFFGFAAGRWTLAPPEGPAPRSPLVQQDLDLESKGVVVHFILEATEARTVSVVGSFNGWAPKATPMIAVEGRWITRLRLPPGRHESQFLIDGERWVVDPAAPATVKDGFGGTNGIVEI